MEKRPYFPLRAFASRYFEFESMISAGKKMSAKFERREIRRTLRYPLFYENHSFVNYLLYFYHADNTINSCRLKM